MVLPSMVLFAFSPLSSKEQNAGSLPKELSSREPCAVRLGIVVSKKVGNSVTRNRCKRRLRASFSNIYDQILSLLRTRQRRERLDIIIVVRSHAKLGGSKDIEEQLIKSLPGVLSKMLRKDSIHRTSIDPGEVNVP